jgi:signal transduction histidine kinase
MDIHNQSIDAAEQVKRLYHVGKNQQELLASLLQGAKIILENPDFSFTGNLLFDKCKSMTHAANGFVYIIGGKGSVDPIFTVDPCLGDLCKEDILMNSLLEPCLQAIQGAGTVLENGFTIPTGMENQLSPSEIIKNVLMVPLVHNNLVSGLLAMANKEGDFNDVDVAVAESFAELITLAWFNSKNLEDLKVARQRAEESDRLKSAFLSNMSHEIRTPLNGILGFSELLAEPGLNTADREQYIRIMNQNGEQLIAIINNILDISLIESGQIVLSKQWIDVRVLVNDVYQLFMSPGLRKENVTYAKKCKCDGEMNLYTDRGRLHQVLVNLFGNATKFTQHGQVAIGCHPRKGVNGEEMVIFIEDTGIGIPQEKLDTIFERFRQADRNTKKNYGGTGLGLAISKGLTELLGGRIEVSSKPLVGSVFSVIFPLEVRNS